MTRQNTAWGGGRAGQLLRQAGKGHSRTPERLWAGAAPPAAPNPARLTAGTGIPLSSKPPGPAELFCSQHRGSPCSPCRDEDALGLSQLQLQARDSCTAPELEKGVLASHGNFNHPSSLSLPKTTRQLKLRSQKLIKKKTNLGRPWKEQAKAGGESTWQGRFGELLIPWECAGAPLQH